jgi:hypothetical protein
MAKKQEVVDNLLDALLWMRRKAKKHEAVDDLIVALVKMRRKAKKRRLNARRPKRKQKNESNLEERWSRIRQFNISN